MKTVHIRKTICTLFACIMMAYCLPSCTGTAPVSTTVSGTTQQTGSEAPKELPDVDEQIKKLSNVQGNIWINGDPKYKDLLGRLVNQLKDNVSLRGSLIIATDDDIIVAAGMRLKDKDGSEVTPYTTY